MILQLFIYSAAQNSICLHMINLNSKASSFSNSSCHFYAMLNTARNLNIMTSLATCDTRHVHFAVRYSDNHSYRFVQLLWLTSEKNISHDTRFSSVKKGFHCICRSYNWIHGPLFSLFTVLICTSFYVNIFFCHITFLD
jgi:hypothetical protein